MKKINLKFKNKNYGFTLIELLVVISIISVLSSVVFASLGTGRAKAQEAKKKVEVNQVGTAIKLFSDSKGVAPTSGGQTVSDKDTDSSKVAIYNAAMKELVDVKVLSSIPISPNDVGYYYFNDENIANGEGAVFFTPNNDGTITFAGSESAKSNAIKSLNESKCDWGKAWNGKECINDTNAISKISYSWTLANSILSTIKTCSTDGVKLNTPNSTTNPTNSLCGTNNKYGDWKSFKLASGWEWWSTSAGNDLFTIGGNYIFEMYSSDRDIILCGYFSDYYGDACSMWTGLCQLRTGFKCLVSQKGSAFSESL